ncbi:hypothetical protein SLA_2132 [Streptomyces laurentii]|uniref:Uncharacterized protein n=1 Tax=Streptomyces laurentii TaxID=39478 RepID=A0A160NY58_STRLU|nr:hypothetical protein SLA_2132 [Streptomyces laurentii]
MENDNMRSTDEACEAVVRELGDALERAGIVLPSLGLDAVTLTSGPPRAPLVDLGRCSAGIARQLTEALLRARADRADPAAGPVDAKHGNEGGRG